jgi:hypothetical protein
VNAIGFNNPLYILSFDQRTSLQTKMFGWTGAFTPEQTAEIATSDRGLWLSNL